jgi:hypothetical protein
MGLAMGATIVAIVVSPWGKQSGAHFNRAVTFTFYRLGKVASWDTISTAPDNFLARLPASPSLRCCSEVRRQTKRSATLQRFPVFTAGPLRSLLNWLCRFS